MLYKIKNAHKLKVQDLKGIASFNRIVKAYLKMLRIEKRGDETKQDTPADDTSMFHEGMKARWADPALADYPTDQRDDAAARIFTVTDIDRENGTAFISDGVTEAEVYLDELIPA